MIYLCFVQIAPASSLLLSVSSSFSFLSCSWLSIQIPSHSRRAENCVSVWPPVSPAPTQGGKEKRLNKHVLNKISDELNLNISLSYMQSAIMRSLQPRMRIENILIPTTKYKQTFLELITAPLLPPPSCSSFQLCTLCFPYRPPCLLTMNLYPAILFLSLRIVFIPSLFGISSFFISPPFLSVPVTAPVQTLSGELCSTL